MDKPWYKSVAILGGSIAAAIQSGEVLGVLPAGVSTNLATSVAGLTGLYGLRRSMPKDLSVFTSLSMLGGVGMAVVSFLETAGVVPVGAGAQLATIGTGVMTLVGLRRAAG